MDLLLLPILKEKEVPNELLSTIIRLSNLDDFDLSTQLFLFQSVLEAHETENLKINSKMKDNPEKEEVMITYNAGEIVQSRQTRSTTKSNFSLFLQFFTFSSYFFFLFY